MKFETLDKALAVINDIFKNIDFTDSYSEAVITAFVYKNFNKEHFNLLDTFIKSHEINNKNSLIIIFTNADNVTKNFSERVRFIKIPYLNEDFMTYRIAFNYNVFHKFLSFKKIYIFDTDMVALKNYENIIDNKFDVGISLCNNWFKINKFPINAGFILINNELKKNIEVFADNYLSAYKSVLKNKKLIMEKTKIQHSKIDLEKWWGDQYLFFYLFDKFPNNISETNEYLHNNIKFMFHNENYFNFQSIELKKAGDNFNITEYIKEIEKDVFFLHLTGNRKRFVDKILYYVKSKNQIENK